MGIHFLIKNVTEEGIRFLSINVTQMRFIDSWENVTIDFLSLCSSSEAESMASESQLDQALTLLRLTFKSVSGSAGVFPQLLHNTVDPSFESNQVEFLIGSAELVFDFT